MYPEHVWATPQRHQMGFQACEILKNPSIGNHNLFLIMIKLLLPLNIQISIQQVDKEVPKSRSRLGQGDNWLGDGKGVGGIRSCWWWGCVHMSHPLTHITLTHSRHCNMQMSEYHANEQFRGLPQYGCSKRKSHPFSSIGKS